MGTYLYLECRDHTPFLRAEGESAQNESRLPEIRRDIANRDLLVDLHGDEPWEVDLGHGRNNTLRFLIAHPKCQIGIRDEYGREHSIEGDGDE